MCFKLLCKAEQHVMQHRLRNTLLAHLQHTANNITYHQFLTRT
jgi:hypothetical protein